MGKRACFVHALACVMFFLPSTTTASFDAGIAFLQLQQQADGAHTSGNDIATAEQATAEALRVLAARDAGLAFLESAPVASQSTEQLARAIIAGSRAPELIDELRLRQGSNGGFGAYRHHPSNVLDTAFALRAITLIPEAGFAPAPIVNWLVGQQAPTGAWSAPDGAPSVYTTAQALAALWALRHSMSLVTPIASARNSLLAARNADGTWAEFHLTALAVAALAPTLVDGELLASVVMHINAMQLADGSWAHDVYQSALALSALAAADAGYEDRSWILGRVVDGDSGAGLLGATITVTGPQSGAAQAGPAGEFAVAVVNPGTYQFRISVPDYPEVASNVSVAPGSVNDVGTIRLLRGGTGAPEPTVAIMQGTVRDADGGIPLAGVSITLVGRGIEATSAADGSYYLPALEPGAFHAVVSKPDYRSVALHGNLVAGATVLFSPSLQRGTSTTFSLRGTVTDFVTGLPVAGAVVGVLEEPEKATATDGLGNYALQGLTPGTVTVAVVHDDYDFASMVIEAEANQEILFSPALRPSSGEGLLDLFGTVRHQVTGAALAGVVVTLTYSGGTESTVTDGAGRFEATIPESEAVQASFAAGGFFPRVLTLPTAGTASFEVNVLLQPEGPETARLVGRLVDSETQAPLAGAFAAVSHDGGSVSTTTDDAGAFELAPAPLGVITLDFSATGYEAVTYKINIVKGGTVYLGDWTLDRIREPGEEPPPVEVEPIEVSGVVVDSQSNLPIAGALVVASLAAGTESFSTDGDGAFAFHALPGELGDLAVSASGYLGVQVGVYIDAETPDLGQVRLRPEGLDTVLPDLAVHHASRAVPASDPDSFLVVGSIDVALTLAGPPLDVPSVKVIAFHDTNGDGGFDPSTDTLLGSIAIPGSEFGVEPLTRTIQLDGVLPFRDAPISVFVDANGVVVERDETNNVRTTAALCRRIPDPLADLRIRTKWHWQGSEQHPSAFSVYGPVVVGQLTDDNGDGVIDHLDTPDAVFLAFQGALRLLTAVSGDDGRTLWQVEGNMSTAASAALGDLTGNGVVDIIVPSANRDRLMAFRNDGTPLWNVPTGLTQSGTNPTRDGVAIADLDGDGIPEVIHANRAYRADGTRMWTGSGDRGGRQDYGYISIVADINMDGRPNVLAGRTLYNNNGQIIWNRTNLHSDGFNAVADFTGDGKPEIVLVSQGINPGRIYLLNNNGQIIWGPVSMPGGGHGGPPTIGDFDGNGVPDIGIAGATRYVVFNADGSIKWQMPIQDLSSHKTGSSLFDFEGDGKMEVVFADEINLYIFDGTTGAIRAQIPNASGTTLEYPIIVDIDNNGSANILVGSTSTETRGVRALEADGPGWMPTRSIWNQHSYHITNVNDDGSIPAVEPHSWQVHNTYRAAALLSRDPLDAADLTIGRLRIHDPGAGEPLRLAARVGNAGIIPSVADIVVSFFDGADAGAPLLGTVVLGPIAPGAWQDIELGGLSSVSGIDGITAVLDVAGRGFDCDDSNNAVWQPGLPTLGVVVTTLDASVYGPERDVIIAAAVTNTGSFTRDYLVVLHVEDADGSTVTSLDPIATGAIVSGAEHVVTASWNTALNLAGGYRVRVELLAADGEAVQTTSAPFSIAHDESGGPAVTLRASTDRMRYHTTDLVLADVLAQNVSAIVLLNASEVELAITGPAGTVFGDTLPVQELTPGSAAALVAVYEPDGAAIGDYVLTAVWRSGHGAVLATAEASFEMFNDLAQALRGSVVASPATVHRGEPVLCTVRVTNTGVVPVTVPLRHVVVSLDEAYVQTGTPVGTALAVGAQDTTVHSIATQDLAEAPHACIVQAEIDGEWVSLASAVFDVTSVPIRIEAALAAGERGRLLLLLDPACADRDPPQTTGGTCDHDPYGPSHAPALPVQRAHLEAVLADAGWRVTVVTNAADFETEFRSRAYEVYALFNEAVKLPEALQHEITADIAAGRGLLVAGDHDRRNGRLEEALGIHSLGKNFDVMALIVEPVGSFAGGELSVVVAEKPNAMRLEGAEVIGRYRVRPSGNQQPYLEPGLTRHVHGRGTGIYAGFDFPIHSAHEGDDGEYAGLLRGTLEAVHPAPYAPIAGRVFPLRLVLQNAGIATSGQVELHLPVGAVFAEGPAGAAAADQTVVWPFTLALDGVVAFDVWIRLPEASGWAAFEAVVFAPDGDDRAERTRVQILLNVQPEE